MKQIVSILFSVILLLSHLNLTIGTHLCEGKAVKTKLMVGHESLSCNIEDMEMSCNDSDTENKDLSFAKLPCCENQYQTFSLSDDFVKIAAETNLNIDFVVVLAYISPDDILSPKTTHHKFADYPPPLLEKEIQVLFQSFLI